MSEGEAMECLEFTTLWIEPVLPRYEAAAKVGIPASEQCGFWGWKR